MQTPPIPTPASRDADHTLRMNDPLVYFAAHAPEEPWACFAPDLSSLGPEPQRPSFRDPIWGFTPQQVEVLLNTWPTADLPWAAKFTQAVEVFEDVKDAYCDREDFLRRTQWPWWYARHVLAARPPG